MWGLAPSTVVAHPLACGFKGVDGGVGPMGGTAQRVSGPHAYTGQGPLLVIVGVPRSCGAWGGALRRYLSVRSPSAAREGRESAVAGEGCE